MDGQSLNLTAEKIAQMRAIFPEVFAEDKIDFARLKDILGESVAFPNEHYELTWAGKTEARKEIQKQTTATLVPATSNSFGDQSGNLFIEGENLQVLRVLLKSYFGKVKMIYIDPPYNTGNDSFVYPDDYAERLDDYNKRTGTTDEQGYLNKQDLWHKNTRENGQFHSVWLSMMYPRLYVARNLLREDGVIFVSIDDNEAANLRLLMDEVFGQENLIGQIIWKKKHSYGKGQAFIIPQTEYILCYAKDISSAQDFGIEYSDTKAEEFEREDEKGKFRLLRLWHTAPRGGYERKTLQYKLYTPDGEPVDSVSGQWLWNEARMKKEIADNNVVFVRQPNGSIRAFKKDHLDPERTEKPTSLYDKVTTDDATKEFNELLPDVQETFFTKPTELIKDLISWTTRSSSSSQVIILDFFAGSGTTAQAVLELNEEDEGNRQFVLVQMPEILDEQSEACKAGYRTIADICVARIRKVIEKMQAERSTQPKLEGNPQPLGFQAFRIAPSNFKQWRGDVQGKDAILEQLRLFRHSEKETSESDKMLYEILLKAGLPLTAKIEPTQIEGQPVYVVEDSQLLAFFDGYNPAIKEYIHQRKPEQVVCLDRVFSGDDQAISNFKLELKEADIELTII